MSRNLLVGLGWSKASSTSSLTRWSGTRFNGGAKGRYFTSYPRQFGVPYWPLAPETVSLWIILAGCPTLYTAFCETVGGRLLCVCPYCV